MSIGAPSGQSLSVGLASHERDNSLFQNGGVSVHEAGLVAQARLLGLSQPEKDIRVEECTQLVQFLGQVAVFVNNALLVGLQCCGHIHLSEVVPVFKRPG